MGSIRGRNRTGHYDPKLLENWTLARLKEELNKKGVRFPKNARRMALVRLLQHNMGENEVSAHRMTETMILQHMVMLTYV